MSSMARSTHSPRETKYHRNQVQKISHVYYFGKEKIETNGTKGLILKA